MRTQVRRLAVYSAVVIIGVLLGVTGAAEYLPGFADLNQVFRTKAPPASAIPDPGEEQLLMIYFGASTCGWCARPETHELLRSAAFTLRETAEDSKLGFVAIGVALELQLEEGLDHLRLIGIFDQVSAGYSWANVVAIDTFKGVLPRITATPTIAVVRRRLNVTDQMVSSTDVRLVAFKMGIQQISPWVQAGTPVRSVTQESTTIGRHDAEPQQERRQSTGR